MIIDPKMLGGMWNDLPSGQSVNYKLIYKRGVAPPVSKLASSPADLADSNNSQINESQGATGQEALESKMWADYDRLKKV